MCLNMNPSGKCHLNCLKELGNYRKSRSRIWVLVVLKKIDLNKIRNKNLKNKKLSKLKNIENDSKYRTLKTVI